MFAVFVDQKFDLCLLGLSFCTYVFLLDLFSCLLWISMKILRIRRIARSQQIEFSFSWQLCQNSALQKW